MKRILLPFFIIVFLSSILPLHVLALDYHWEGGWSANSWNDIRNWSTRPGNTGPFTDAALLLPGSNDDVYFDNNSFDPASANVIISGAPVATCRKMDWTGATSVVNPVIEGNGRLEIYGDLILVANIDILFTGIIEFKGPVEQDIKAFPSLNGTVIINNPIKCTLSAPLTVRNITITNTSTLDVTKIGISSNNKITVRGNWQGNGIFIARNGTVAFEGTHPTIPQTIFANTTTGNHEFFNIEINNSGAGVNLLSEVKIGKNVNNAGNNGSVIFTDGIVRSSTTNVLVFYDDTFVRTRDDDGNPVTGDASNESHVVGPVRKIGNDSFRFPVGNDNANSQFYRPIGIVSPAPGTVSVYQATYFDQTPINPGSTSNSIPDPPSAQLPLAGIVDEFEYWTLENISGPNNPKVLLSWDEAYLTSKGVPVGYLPPYTNLVTASYNEATGQWDNKGGIGHTGNQVKGNVTGTNAFGNVGFKRYTISSVVIPLPIDLLYFKADIVNGTVHFDWATASEKDNDYFTIEKSTDSKHFEALLEADAVGNSQQVQMYSAVDPNPVSPVTYYRLKQTDIDGKFTYSKIVAVHSGSKASLSILPLSEKQIKLSYYLPQAKEGVLTVYDTKGVLVWNKMVSGSASQQTETLKLSYPSGMYLVTLQQAGETIVQKIFIR